MKIIIHIIITTLFSLTMWASQDQEIVNIDQLQNMDKEQLLSVLKKINLSSPEDTNPEQIAQQNKDLQKQMESLRRLASLQKKFLESTNENSSQFIAKTIKKLQPLGRKAVHVVSDKNVMDSLLSLIDHPRLRMTTIVNFVFSIIFLVLTYLKRRSIQSFLKRVAFTFTTFGVYLLATTIIIPLIVLGSSYKNLLFALAIAIQNT